ARVSVSRTPTRARGARVRCASAARRSSPRARSAAVHRSSQLSVTRIVRPARWRRAAVSRTVGAVRSGAAPLAPPPLTGGPAGGAPPPGAGAGTGAAHPLEAPEVSRYTGPFSDVA